MWEQRFNGVTLAVGVEREMWEGNLIGLRMRWRQEEGRVRRVKVELRNFKIFSADGNRL